uniref:Uncharacterized protein n=1 Tax=Arundo donax TaxID=35708 RepID=A0A0A9USL6_ARUDO
MSLWINCSQCVIPSMHKKDQLKLGKKACLNEKAVLLRIVRKKKLGKKAQMFPLGQGSLLRISR